MKVIVKPKGFEIFDAIRVQDHIGKVLVDTEEIFQEIRVEGEDLWLVENSKSDEMIGERHLIGTNTQKVSLKEEDLLIKLEKGYTLPIAQFIELNKPLENAVKKINNIK